MEKWVDAMLVEKKKSTNVGTRVLKILLFMYVFFPFRIKPLASLQAYILYAVELILIVSFSVEVYYNNVRRKKWYPIFMFIFLFGCLTILALILPIIKNTGDMTYFMRYCSFLKKMMAVIGLAYLSESFNDFLKMFVYATTIYVLVTVVMLIPSIHSIYSDLVVIQESALRDYQLLQSARYYTRIGLQGLSGYGWAFRCSFSVALCCCGYIIRSLDFSFSDIIFCGLINFLGTIFYGRTGTIIAIVCIIFTAGYHFFLQRKGGLVVFLSCASLLLILIFAYSIEYIQGNASLSWIFEGFLNIAQSGKFSTNSTTYILDKMFVQISADTFFFGDARYTEASGLYYMGTDLGIIRPLLFWGIGGQIIYYVMPLTLLFPIKKHLNNKHSVFLFSIIVLVFVGFELKGEINLEFCIILLGMYLALIRGTFSERLCLKFKKSYSYVQEKTDMLKLDEGEI